MTKEEALCYADLKSIYYVLSWCFSLESVRLKPFKIVVQLVYYTRIRSYIIMYLSQTTIIHFLCLSNCYFKTILGTHVATLDNCTLAAF